jgi:hypothetical protein
MLTGAVGGPALGAEDKGSQPTKTKPSRKTPMPQPEYDRVAAKQAYEEALRAFNLGHWQDAVAGFEKSYTLSGDAALLFNVAQAQRQAGNFKEAIIAYKAFLREKPDTPHREMIEAKLKDLEAGAETKTAATRPADSKPQADRLTGVWEDPFAERKAAASEPSPAAPAAATATPAEKVPPVATVAPAGPVPPPAPAEPISPQAIPKSSPSTASPVVIPAPSPASQEPPQVNEDALDLHQQPATQEVAAGSGGRWWLWTGIAAVVAAGVVTAVILSSRGPERDVSCPLGVNGCLPVGK